MLRRLLVILAMLLWTALVFVGWTAGWWRAMSGSDAAGFVEAVRPMIEREAPGSFALVLLDNGAVAHEHYAASAGTVGRDTLFQLASLSKWVSAWGVLALVEAGRLDLDAPVSRYLSRWQLPESRFDTAGVTVRRLLSHTAGLTDGLGYNGFADPGDLQSLEQSLTSAADAARGADGRVRVGLPPGAQWRYSGGGYTLLQLLVEEVTGQPFADYMQAKVLAPLGMTRATYHADAAEARGLAPFYDAGGAPARHYRYTATAAAALYAAPADLVRFLQAHLPGPDGAPVGRGVLSPGTVAAMRAPHASRLGVELWGMGTMLFAPTASGDFVIGHDGANAPAINTTARLDPQTGDGIIVLVSGDPGLATELGGAWVLWQTGEVDFVTLATEARAAATVLLLGLAVIVAATWITACRRAHPRR